MLIIFLGPAVLVLSVLVIYPIIYSIVRSTFDRTGENFVGLGNYVRMFTDPQTFTALTNNLLWVLIAPMVCTVLGLIFAVLMERIRWQSAFKLIVFMPMAISMLAAGVIFRSVFQQNPDIGVANAAIVSIKELFGGNQEVYPGARPRDAEAFNTEGGALTSLEPVQVGTSDAAVPLVGVSPELIPDDVEDAIAPEAAGEDQIAGTVWLDFVRGGGGEPGELGDGKSGLPGITVEALDPNGEVVASTTTEANGTFVLEDLDPGSYTLSLPESNFAPGAQGINWLGPDLVTWVTIMAYVWIWAGFAMVMIASGLSAIDRSLLEAARTDGASEWKVFRHITVPQLAPVLMVVLVTLIINVLKIFDLVYVIPPGESKPAADVIATRMWTVSFGGGNDQGLGSALAIFLLVLVLPAMLVNIRNFKRGGQR